jgi:hypothetical protein
MVIFAWLNRLLLPDTVARAATRGFPNRPGIDPRVCYPAMTNIG